MHLGIDLMIAASQTTATSPSAGTYGNTYAATSPGTYTATPTTGETWVNELLPMIKLFNSVETLYTSDFGV